MAARTRPMTDGAPLRLIVTFALPLMAGNMFQQLYIMVDSMVVGKGLGVDALAAVGATDWVNWMMIGLLQGLAQGFTIPVAQAFGARDHEELRSVVGSSAILAVICSLVLLLIGQAAAGPLLLLMRTPADILPSSLVYMRLIYLGIPVVLIYNLLAGILRALGDGKTPLYAMIVASLINIALDLVFVLVFHWGIAGAAVATLLAQICSSVYCFVQLRRIDVLHLQRKHFQPERNRMLRLLAMGAPMAGQNVLIAVGGMIIQMVVNGFGVLFIAGFTASNKLYGLLEIAATSFGYAMVTYVGQNLGARNFPRIRRGVRAAVLSALVIASVIAVLMIVFGRFLVGLFVSGTLEDVERTIAVAYEYLTVMSICLPVLYLLHVYRSSLQGLGNTILPMVSGIAELAVRTLCGITLPLLLGEQGVYVAEVLAWAGAVLILIPSYYTVLRKLACSGNPFQSDN